MPESKRRYRVVHPQISYLSTETGEQVEAVAGDEITDIAGSNWLITEGLVRQVHKDDDPKEIAAAANAVPTDTVQIVAGQPIPDMIIVVPDPVAAPVPLVELEEPDPVETDPDPASRRVTKEPK